MDVNTCRFYDQELEANAPSTVCVFDKGDYSIWQATDALLVAKEIFKADSLIKRFRYDAADRLYVTLNRRQTALALRQTLLGLQRRVHLYRCVGAARRWTLEAKGSPGNLTDFEGLLDEVPDDLTAGPVMVVQLGTSVNTGLTVAVAFCDMESMTFTVSEFSDTVQFNNLQSAVIQMAPKECCIAKESGGLLAEGELMAVMKRCSVAVTEIKKGDFKAADIVVDLDRLLKLNSGVTTSAHLPALDSKASMYCLAAAIRYLDLLKSDTYMGCFHLVTLNLSRHLRLDAGVVRALELFHNSYTQTRKGTLYELLNRCRSVAGQRLLEQWIRQPLRDSQQINERLDIVDVLCDSLEIRRVLRDSYLCRVPDLQAISKRLIRKKSGLQDCYKLYQVISLLPKLTRLFGELQLSKQSCGASVRQLLMEPIAYLDRCLQKFVDLVETSIDLRHMESKRELRLLPFDDNLRELTDALDAVQNKLDIELTRCTKLLNLDSTKVKYEFSAVAGGNCFRITKKDEKVLRSSQGGDDQYRVVDSARGGIRFTNRRLDALNADYNDARNAFDVCQKEIVEQIMDIVAGYLEPIRRLGDAMAQLDVLVCFAEVATSAALPYTRPTVVESGDKLQLFACRHPCLEAQDNVSFIPNDVVLSKGDDGSGANVAVVTGPNMGGKSTYLRQTALAALMAQMGCFVAAAAGTCLPLFDAVFARVGAADCQAKGVSTFMAEMLDTAAIVKGATEHSLVIIDELGRGTSTYDGFGLAWGVAKHVATELRCWCLFATHFHELAELAGPETEGHVKALRMSASVQDNEVVMVYQVEPGISDNSFGIQVAKLVQFPDRIIQASADKLQRLHSHEAATKRRKDELNKELEKLKELTSNGGDVTTIHSQIRHILTLS